MRCAGNAELVTPHLDRLAETGIRFENFFCASPVCSPARASILTGSIPSQHGVQDFLRKGNNTLQKSDGINIDYMADQKSYIEILSADGYNCGLSGKWHLGHASLPQLGFSYWNAHAAGGGNYYKAPMVVNGEYYQPEEYVTDVITDNALTFLDESLNSSTPFSLNVHYTAPHAPWGREHHPKDLFDDYYDNCPFDSLPNQDIHPDQLNKEPGAATIGDTPENRRSALSGYFAAITAMDQNIGRLIDWLEDNNLRENTLVIFNADNGMNMGHHGMWGKGNAIYPPNMYDTSVKVPALISRPNHVPQGLVCSDLLSQYDFMPTILSYVGSQNPHKDSLPGRDFSPILNGGQMGEDAAVFVLDEYGPTRMIRTHTWKYIHRYPDGPSEMYNLEEDPDETTNLIGDSSQTARAEELKSELEQWYAQFVIPKMDGSKQNVTGRGQIGLVGSDDYDKPFADDLVFYADGGPPPDDFK